MKKNTIKKAEAAKTNDFVTEAETMRQNELKRAAAEAKKLQEDLSWEEFEAETERLQEAENARRAAEAMKPKTVKGERFCKTRSNNKELLQLLANQRHQSQLAAWEHRKQKYGQSGYKAGHSPLANRSKKAEV